MKLKEFRKLTRGLPGNTPMFINSQDGKDHTGVTAEVEVNGETRKGTRRIRDKDIALVTLSSPSL